MPEYGDQLNEVITDLSRTLLSEENLETTLQRVATLASRVLPHAEAGVTLMEKGKPLTAAATGDLVTDLDLKQYASAEGPCMQAMKVGERVHAPDLATEERWPVFTARARELDVKSALGIPLVVNGESEGSLNLYCSTSDGFDAHDQENAQMFADQAAVALHNTLLYQKSVKLAEQLQEALGSRAIIDQAKGVLMERERVGADEAFAMLRDASQRLNIKVRDIAQKIVDRSQPNGEKS